MSYFSTTLTLDDYPIISSESSTFTSNLSKANSYWCPLGKAVGKAFVLLRKQDIDAISAGNLSFHTLKFVTKESGQADQTLSITGLVWLNAKRVYPGHSEDNETLYLVELADRRIIAQQFSDTGKKAFNIRSFAQADEYLADTEGFTWESIAQEIWNTMSGVLGNFPGLPNTIAPASEPENLQFNGLNSWQVLHDLLDKIHCTTAYDPVQDSFSIINLGESQTNLPEEEPYLFNEQTISYSGSFIPETVRVYFKTHYRNFGQERDTQPDNNWLIDEHSAFIDVATNHADAIAGTVISVWDDLARVLDEGNNVENQSALDNKATARMESWLAGKENQTERKQVYSTILHDISVGSEIKSIIWRNRNFKQGGSSTEVLRSPIQLIDAWNQSTASLGSKSQENWQPIDIARQGTPAFPRLINAVQAWDEQLELGETIEPNGDGLIPGRVVRWVAGSLTTLEDCWIHPISLEDSEEPSESEIVPVRHGDRFIARLSGIKTSSSETLPLYLAQVSQNNQIEPAVIASLNSDLVAWPNTPGCQSVSCEIVSCSGSGGEAAETIEVIFPNVPNKVPVIGSGDYVGAVPTDLSASPKKYIATTDYSIADSESIGKPAIIASLNADLIPWSDSPGCQTVSAEIVSCSGSAAEEIGTSIDIIFPNVPGKVPAIGSGDYVGAVPSSLTSFPKTYVVSSDYSKTEGTGKPAAVASLNADLTQWSDSPGCQVVSGDIVVCNGSAGADEGESIEIIFPNIPGKVPSISSGDYVGIVPSDITTTPKKYLACTDYSKTESYGTRPIELTSDVAGGSAGIKFLDDSGTTDTGQDRCGSWEGVKAGSCGYVAWVILAQQYEFIDLPCPEPES